MADEVAGAQVSPQALQVACHTPQRRESTGVSGTISRLRRQKSYSCCKCLTRDIKRFVESKIKILLPLPLKFALHQCPADSGGIHEQLSMAHLGVVQEPNRLADQGM